MPLPAAQPAELELGGLAVGDYDVEVTADSPVVAAVWQTTGFGEGADFAWYTPAPARRRAESVRDPGGAAAVAHVVNPARRRRAIVAVSSADGTVPPRGHGRRRPATHDGAPRAAARSTRSTPAASDIRAGISLAGDGALAGFPVWPADAAARRSSSTPDG